MFALIANQIPVRQGELIFRIPSPTIYALLGSSRDENGSIS